ncbi:hypothetical protein L8S13_20895 [Vibrio lentus]|uniref:nicotianamine synthase family protein n=1 Tax=Vibrio lentus TaxID=136468 RepID=UPI0024683ED3|nr:nicotianamine synthase family protein [Vibrio lentus]MDH5928760.1 hypothetical protein [Vibrio lentus]
MSLKETISNIASNIDCMCGEESDVVMTKLWVELNNKQNFNEDILSDSDVIYDMKIINPLWHKYIKNMENKQAIESIRNHSYKSVLAEEGYESVENELALYPGREINNVAVLGCGPYPETLMEIAKSNYVKGKVVGIDSDFKSILLAKEVIDCCIHEEMMKERIDFFHSTTINVDYSDFDMVFMMNGIINKKETMSVIDKTGNDGLVVIYRSPIELAKLLYELVDFSKNFIRIGELKSSSIGETIAIKKIS